MLVFRVSSASFKRCVAFALAGLFVLLPASSNAVTAPTPSPSSTTTPQPSASPTDGVLISPTPTPTPIIKPGKVQNLTVAGNEIGLLTLGWQEPLSLGSDPIVDYKVQYNFDQYKSWVLWKHEPSTETSIQIPDLPLGTGYSFSVRPVTASAVGMAVSVHTVTPSPDAPRGLRAGIQKQYNFLAASWNCTSSPRFGFLRGVDCANWASQSLLQRGLKQSGKWRGRQSRTIPATRAWISSTAMHDYFLASKRATLLTDAQRDQVAIGDVVQFDWWNKGAQEHTGVVTHIARTENGIKIYYASDTAAGMWWSVDRSIQTIYPGATATYLHIAG